MSVTNIAAGTDIGAAPSPGEALRLPRPRFAAWRWLSLRAQLLIVFIVVDLIAAGVAGGVVIMRARTSTRVEIAASMNLAEALVTETIRVTQQQSPAAALAEAVPLRGRFMRHVRISVRNAADLQQLTRSFRELFEAFAAQTPLPAEGGPLADGRAFVQTIAPGEWADDVRLEVLAIDLRLRRTAKGLRPRRGPTLKVAWLRQARRLVIGGRLPWLGTWACSLPRWLVPASGGR